MTDFVREAIREKIARQQADASQAEAKDKPVSYNEPVRSKDGAEDENPPSGSDRVG